MAGRAAVRWPRGRPNTFCASLRPRRRGVLGLLHRLLFSAACGMLRLIIHVEDGICMVQARYKPGRGLGLEI